MIKEKYIVLKIANVYGSFVFAMGNIGMEQILDTMMDVKMVWMNFIVMVKFKLYFLEVFTSYKVSKYTLFFHAYHRFCFADYENSKSLIEANSYNETICKSVGGSFYGYSKFGYAMLIPVFLSMFFITIQWWNNERKTSYKNKIGTFFLVLLQFYPQWQMLKVLKLGLCNIDIKWREKKEEIVKNLGSLGNKNSNISQQYSIKIEKSAISNVGLDNYINGY